MDIVYRPMHLSDIDKVWELLEVLKMEKAGVSLIEVPDKDELHKWLQTEDIFLYIAEDEDKVLAVVKGLRGSEPGTRHAVVLSAATHPDFRKQGVAKELTAYALEDMKKDGVTIVRTYVFSDNIPSVNTVLSLGFTLSGCVYRHHYNEKTGRYIDDLIFHKILTE